MTQRTFFMTRRAPRCIAACLVLVAAGCATPPKPTPTQRANAELHIRRALAWRKAGKPAVSQTTLAEAVRIADAVDDARLAAVGHNELGVGAYDAGDPAGALAHFLTAVSKAESAPDMPRLQLAAMVANVGCARAALGQDDLARESYERASRIYRELGDQPGRARMMAMLSELELRRGDVDAAGVLAEDALVVFESLDDEKGIATAEHNLGSVAAARGNLDEARRHYRRALDLFRRAEHPPGLVSAYSALAEIASSGREYALAMEMWQKVLDIARANRYGTWQRRALERLRALAEASDQPHRAAGYGRGIDAIDQGGR